MSVQPMTATDSETMSAGEISMTHIIPNQQEGK